MKTHILHKPLLRAFVLAKVIAALAVAGLAQITTTGIRGIVRDHSGAVIPRATIKLTDNSTGIEQPPFLRAMAAFSSPTCSLAHTN